MATAIVTDSNCGIAVDEAETLNIHIIPMPILINEISFYEGLDISYSLFADNQHSTIIISK